MALTGGKQRTPRDLGGGVISTTLQGRMLPRSLSLSLFLLHRSKGGECGTFWNEAKPIFHDAIAIRDLMLVSVVGATISFSSLQFSSRKMATAKARKHSRFCLWWDTSHRAILSTFSKQFFFVHFLLKLKTKISQCSFLGEKQCYYYVQKSITVLKKMDG